MYSHLAHEHLQRPTEGEIIWNAGQLRSKTQKMKRKEEV